MTLEQLAHEAQVGVRQLARVEAGRASPSLVWLYSIAEALDVKPERLIASP